LPLRPLQSRTRTQGHKDTRTQGHKDTRTQGHKDTRTQGHKDTRTQGHKDKFNKWRMSWQLAARAKPPSGQNGCGSSCKILNFPVLSSHYYFGDLIWLDLVDPNILLWYPLHNNDYPHRTIQHSQTHPGKCHLAEPGGCCLEIALQQHGCQSILDVMALTPWAIETLQWTDDSKPKRTLGRSPLWQVIHLQAFALSLHPSPISNFASSKAQETT
jgi:hypothetical protein